MRSQFQCLYGASCHPSYPRTIIVRHHKAALYHPFVKAVVLTLNDISITFCTTAVFAILLYFRPATDGVTVLVSFFCAMTMIQGLIFLPHLLPVSVHHVPRYEGVLPCDRGGVQDARTGAVVGGVDGADINTVYRILNS
jgi:hypothetical protein